MLSKLLEDARSDKIARDTAEMVFNSIIKTIETNGNTAFRMIGDSEAFVAESSAFKLPKTVPDFKFVLRKQIKGRPDIKGGYSTKQTAIHLVIDLEETWVEQIKQLKTFFIHEFIHHLDVIRSDNKAAPSSNQSTKEYYNNNLETNAYFQEALHEFESFYEKIFNKGERTFNLFASKIQNFETFHNFLLSNADADFVKYASPETKRKFTKRASGYFQDILLPDIEKKKEEF